MTEPVYATVCTIKGCKIWAESTKLFGLELCTFHQRTVDKWLVEKGYSREIK